MGVALRRAVEPGRIAIGIAALLATVPPAHAEPVPVPAPVVATPERIARFALVVREPADAIVTCGGPAAVKAAVERRLDRDVFIDEAAADATLVVEVERLERSPRWQTRIVERDRSGNEVGHRELVIDAENCAKGVDTLAVVLAIMIGPPRRIAGEEPAAPLPSGEPRPAAPPPPPPARPADAPARLERSPAPARARWALSPFAGMSAGSGILPGIAWGVEGGVVIRPPVPRLSLLARAQVWPSRSTGTIPEGHLDRLSAAALGCYLVARIDVASFTACAGFDVGRLHTSAPSSLLEGPKSVSRVLLDVPFEARVGFELPARGDLRIEPILAGQLAVLILRDRFTYVNRDDRETTLHRAAAVAVQATVGVAVHFGP